MNNKASRQKTEKDLALKNEAPRLDGAAELAETSELAEFFKTGSLVFRLQLKSEWAEPERMCSLLLFSINLILLFWFAAADVADKFPVPLFITQSYLTLFVALQIAFVRLFEPEEADRAFDHLVVSPINYGAWYVAKLMGAVVSSLLLVVPTVLISALFSGESIIIERLSSVLALASSSAVAASSLGVLLSALVARVGARQILFPLLYFPLSAPVLLCAVNATSTVLSEAAANAATNNPWLALLAIFTAVYFLLGFIFYGDLLRS